MPKVWVVFEEVDSVAAVYSAESLAAAHADEMGGWVSESEVLDALAPHVTDPAQVQARADDAEKRRQEGEARRIREEREAIARANVRPHDRMGLCHCVTFNGGDQRFINAHGYCGYCGGFTISVFRAHRGEAALQAEIDKLALHNRKRMREIAAVTP